MKATGEVGHQVIRFIGLGGLHQAFYRERLAEIDHFMTGLTDKIGENKQSQLMPFPIPKEKEKGLFIDRLGMEQSVDGDEDFLPDEVGDEMFLGGVDAVGLPEYTNFIEEGINDLVQGLLESKIEDGFVDDLFEFNFIKLYHGRQQGIVLYVGQGFILGEGDHFGVQGLIGEPGKHGDLVPLSVQQGHVEDLPKVSVVVITYVGLGPLGREQSIPFLPYTQGMGFDTRQFLKIFDGVLGFPHICSDNNIKTKGKHKSFKLKALSSHDGEMTPVVRFR